MEIFEKKYNKALGWIRKIYPSLNDSDKENAELYFPELKESKDEIIRKEIIDYLNFAESHNLLRSIEYKKKKEWITYLEKQKEQKFFLQPHWKPSEEQIRCLFDCVSRAKEIHNASVGGYDAYPILVSLFNDINNLL